MEIIIKLLVILCIGFMVGFGYLNFIDRIIKGIKKIKQAQLDNQNS